MLSFKPKHLKELFLGLENISQQQDLLNYTLEQLLIQ